MKDKNLEVTTPNEISESTETVDVLAVAQALNYTTEKIELPEDKKKMHLPKKIEKELFIQWLAQPEKARNPRTSKEFSKMFDVSEQTLSKWTHDTEVLSEVIARRKRDFIKRGSNVLEALYKRAITGDPVAIKLYYQYSEDWGEKIKQEHKAEGGLANLLKELGNNPEKLVK
jgi:hypothetical protein